MTAEIVLSIAVEEILKKAGSIAIDRIAGAWGLKKDLEKLRRSIESIQAVLLDAEEKQATNEPVKRWLMELQDVVYDAEDLFDEFSYETLRRKIEIQDQMCRKVLNFFSRNNPMLFQMNMVFKLKKVNESLADIKRQASDEVALRSITGTNRPVVLSTLPGRETDSLLDKSEKQFGRTSDVEEIIKMMQVSPSKPPLITVVSMIGIAGLGKTTLAKLVLKEVKEKKLFDETIWVCVSNTFHDKIILGEMLETLDRSRGGLSNIDAILTELQEKLKNKKFLLVLDDVWNEDFQKWFSLKGRLEKICSVSGNFVVVTTRSSIVANTMETNPQHILRLKQLFDEELMKIMSLF